jgi:hypothetical protein
MDNNDHTELMDAIAAEEPEQIDLTVVKNKAKELRNLYLQKNDLEQRIKELSKRIQTIERDDLTDLFSQVGITGIDVEADGNHPPFRAERKTVYTAKIPDEKRLEALQWFEEQGHGDLVKSIIDITFGMHEHERRLAVMQLLSDNKIEYYTNESVHSSTLKAFVKREIQKNHIIPYDLLGIFIFDEVKIK